MSELMQIKKRNLPDWFKIKLPTGEKYSKVNSVSVDISNGGYTSKVTFSTDKGSVNIDGQTFKTVFNLRAPAYISIKNRLFGFEKK